MMRTELIRYIEDTWDKLRGEGQTHHAEGRRRGSTNIPAGK